MITLGIDIGSRNTKLVIFDTTTSEVIFGDYLATDISPMRSVEALKQLAFARTSLSANDISASCGTGYGRHLLKGSTKVMSEISCHATGVRYLFPNCMTIIDIGGQDSKVIALTEEGKVRDFVMNDKCAAGTGRFLEMTAIRLGCSLEELSQIAGSSTLDLRLNSTCVVFAESEIISLMAASHSSADISRAVNRSIAHKLCSQIATMPVYPDLVFTGGVAYSGDISSCLELELGLPIQRPAEPELTGALGAAIQAGQ
ncbi:MAG TPA: acyl-CoA dehydratase activase [Candidatus Cloacimonadota bacterium]|nr:acyl-CoA dehydratase activase [Candidatus Cloacimonadota bacterium]HPS38056.1 acyl-CoA dehydratase activase [Candidatus Cloacimonadota bacterium]